MRKAKQIDLEEAIAQKQRERGYNEDGQFMPDPTEIAPPVGYQKQPSMFERVRELVRSEQLRAAAQDNGFESFEDADDFDTGEDDDPSTPYEECFEGRTAEEILDPKRKAYEAEQERRRRAVAPKQDGEPPAAPASPRAPELRETPDNPPAPLKA